MDGGAVARTSLPTYRRGSGLLVRRLLRHFRSVLLRRLARILPAVDYACGVGLCCCC